MKLISSKELLKTPIFTVTEDVAIEPGGFEIKRAIIQHQGSSVIMPVDDGGRVLLVRQYRLPARNYLWELAAGRIDPGETPLKAARRELIEETGYRAKTWTKLASYWASPGFLAERMNLYLAEGLTPGEQTPMEDERIEMRWFTAKEIDDLIEKGKLEDGKSLIGYSLWLRLRKKRNSASKARAR